MAAAFDFQAHISELTKCSICLEDYTDPRSLPCLHTFCFECLKSHCQDKLCGDEILCPICRNSCRIPQAGISAFPLNFFVNDLLYAQNTATLAADKLLLCDACAEVSEGETTDIPPATKYCVDCSQHVCDKCSKIHTKMKTGAHLVVTLGEEMNMELIQLRKRPCMEHKDETVKLYCSDCKTNLCCMCMCFPFKHKEHNIVEISEAAEKLGQDIDEHIKAVSGGITDVQNLKQQWEARKQQFVTEAEKLEVIVKQKGEERKQLIDSHVDSLLQELQHMKLSYSKEVDCNKENLEAAAVAMESYINYSRMVRVKGKPEDITHAADELGTRAATLLQTDMLSKSVQAPDIVFIPTDDNRFSVTEGGLNSVGRWMSEKGTDIADDSDLESKSDAEDDFTASMCDAESMSQSVVSSDAATMTGAAASSSSLPAGDPQKLQPSSPSAQIPQKSPPKTLRRIHTLSNMSAFSLLDKELFVLESPSSGELKVYDATNRTPRGSFTIPCTLPCNFVDMAACCSNHCLYLPDTNNQHIVKLQLPGMLREWIVDDISSDPTVSVTSSHQLLVLCGQSNKLKLFSTDGQLQTTVVLQQDIVNVNSAVELSPGQYIVCHGRPSDTLHRVCVVNSEGKILHVHGGFKGSYPTLLDTPMDVAVDKDGFVYVFEQMRNRLIVLSSKLGYIHSINYNYECPYSNVSSLCCRRVKVDKELRRVYLKCTGCSGRSEFVNVSFVTVYEM